MTAQLIPLLAETFIHPGASQSNGPVDLPVAREAPTGYPFVAGSSMKGAWLDFYKQNTGADDTANVLFGSQDAAGELLFFDGRLLLLPIRCLTGCYKWVTCPHILARFLRDQSRINSKGSIIPSGVPEVEKGRYLGQAPTGGFNKLILEERNFTQVVDDGSFDQWLNYLKPLLAKCDSYTASQLTKQLVVLSNDDFAWFVNGALPIQARNVLDENKQSQNLWYEEALPPDTVMYTIVSTRRNSADDALRTFLDVAEEQPYLQVGANETIGQGVFKTGLAER